MTERVWHYVRSGDTTKVPRRHIFLDTESQWRRTAKGRKQSWRVGVARFRVADKGRQAHEVQDIYRNPKALWEAVSAFCKPRHRTVLWAHNLGYDVRIADAFRILPAMGWRCVGHNLANRGTWLQWRRDDTSLVMVDSSSVFPVPLATLARHFATPKVPLPGGDDSEAAWIERCERDVTILRNAVVAYLQWLEDDNLGNWALTGAGQSYAAFRHNHLTHKMLVHSDEEALEAERRAMWTGRCEAYWKGRTDRVGVEEWDTELAYARIAREALVPVRLIGRTERSVDLRALLARPATALLAEVDVETELPTLPTQIGDRIAWPVGSFSTTVWSPELRLALERGAQLAVRRAWIYQAAPALRQWASWIIDALATDNPDTAAWQRVVLKHWSRALIGRFGMNYTRWERYGTTDDLRVANAQIWDRTTGEDFTLSHIGRDVQRSGGVTEWDQSQPAVTGFVMSAGRSWLYQLTEALGPRRVLYADTDSFYVTAEHHDDALRVARSPIGEGLRLKTSHHRAEILGPRQLITDSRARIAGLPHGAQRMPNGTFEGEVWRSLATTLRDGDPSTVETRDRVWRVAGVDHRRVSGPDGWTLPITVKGGERVG